jgi:hypothetical protein
MFTEGAIATNVAPCSLFRRSRVLIWALRLDILTLCCSAVSWHTARWNITVGHTVQQRFDVRDWSGTIKLYSNFSMFVINWNRLDFTASNRCSWLFGGPIKLYSIFSIFVIGWNRYNLHEHRNKFSIWNSCLFPKSYEILLINIQINAKEDGSYRVWLQLNCKDFSKLTSVTLLYV